MKTRRKFHYLGLRRMENLSTLTPQPKEVRFHPILAELVQKLRHSITLLSCGPNWHPHLGGSCQLRKLFRRRQVHRSIQLRVSTQTSVLRRRMCEHPDGHLMPRVWHKMALLYEKRT